MSRGLVALLVAVTAAAAHAQRIQLELRPHADDTLHMRLDQTMDMSGARGVNSHQMHNALSMFSRAIVERSVATGTVILAIADSVRVTTADEHAQELGDDARRQIEGRQMRLWLSPDGTVEVLDARRRLSKDVNDLVSVMPGSFPPQPVAVGDTWVRVMPVPPAARMGLPLGGVVRVTFHLDSLSSSGDIAYMSMHGNVRQDAGTPGGDPSTLTGEVLGAMVMDRKRGWLSESRFVIDVRASLKPQRDSVPGAMSFSMKVTQHMRVTDPVQPPRR